MRAPYRGEAEDRRPPSTPSRRTFLKASFVGLFVGGLSTASAGEFPDHPIRMVVPYPPGGSVDATARLVAESLRRTFGQSVIVDNRSGAGGNIGAEAVWRSAPDGYSLLFAASGPYAINKALYASLGYDPATFTPVSIVSTSHMVLIANPRLRIRTLRQIIEFAKAHPGALTCASSGKGTISHLTAEAFKSAAGISMTHVPYKGSAPALNDVLGGSVDLGFMELSAVLAYVRAEKVLALGVSSERRKPVLPDVPAIAEVLPGFVSATWFAIAAPPRTPGEIVLRISSAVTQAMRDPAVVQGLNAMNIDTVGGSPADMAALMKEDTERWAKVIRAAGPSME